MYRLANSDDIDDVMRIKNDAVIYMEREGNDQWDSSYPTRETFLSFIDNRYLYIYEEDGEILGIMGLLEKEDEEYSSVNWSFDKALIVHRMALSCKATGKGLGVKMLKFCIEEAKRRGLPSVKLDTYYKNVTAQNLFKKLGFKEVGVINFPQKSGSYYCYELILM